MPALAARRRARPHEPGRPGGNGQFLGPDLYFDDLFCHGRRAARSCRPSRSSPTEDFADDGLVPHPAHQPADGRRRGRGARRRALHRVPARLRPRRGVPEGVRRHRAVARGVGRVQGDRTSTCDRGRATSKAVGARAEDEPTDDARAEICVVAVAEASAATASSSCNPIGNLPMIGGRLARATFEPDLVMTDGVRHVRGERRCPSACADAPSDGRRGVEPVPADVRRALERQAPRDDGRHPDRPLRQPEHRLHRRLAQAQGPAARRSAARPGNTINHTTSYWVPNHSPKVFVEQVDVVCGIGYDRAARARPGGVALPRDPPRRHQPRRARLRDAATTACGCARCTPA